MKLKNRIKQQVYLMIQMIRNSAAPPELEYVSVTGKDAPQKTPPGGSVA